MIDKSTPYAQVLPVLLNAVEQYRGDDPPTPEDLAAVVAAVLRPAPGGAGTLVRKSTPSPKIQSQHEPGAVLCAWALSRWHRGTGDLQGWYAAKWYVSDPERFDRIETAVLLLHAAAGNARSTALEAWQRTGLVSA